MSVCTRFRISSQRAESLARRRIEIIAAGVEVMVNSLETSPDEPMRARMLSKFVSRCPRFGRNPASLDDRVEQAR